jgi:hypothetical protein
MDTIKNDTRKIFWTKGPCSHALYYILNREFGHLKENEEHASDPLAGGIMQNGHQCGMIWGATLAVLNLFAETKTTTRQLVWPFPHLNILPNHSQKGQKALTAAP